MRGGTADARNRRTALKSRTSSRSKFAAVFERTRGAKSRRLEGSPGRELDNALEIARNFERAGSASGRSA
jgi:hypothetical protein